MNRSLSNRYRREFLGVILVLSLLTALVTYILPISSADRIIYDFSLRHAHHRMANEDIVIIAIDDQSLQKLGSWPWRRVLHAQLLRHLGQAKAVGYDISFLGASYYPDDDKEFAHTIQTHGRVVLASFINEGKSTSLPYTPLLEKTNQLGFINVPIDSDGLVRQVDRYIPLLFDNHYHFSLAMLRAAGTPSYDLDAKAFPSRVTIPYAGAPNHYKTVSYADVLNLRFPDDFFKDKYVLIGAWASGLGDKFPTPTTTQSLNMSGVEILANSLQAEIENRWIQEASDHLVFFVSLAWVFLYCFLVRTLPARYIILASIVLLVALFGSHFLFLKYFNLWLRIDPSLAILLWVYPLWNWRLQELVLDQMHREIQSLDNERSLLSMEHVHSLSKDTPYPVTFNTLDTHIDRLRTTLARVRNLRHFIINSLDNIPYATAVFNHQEQFLFATAIAKNYFSALKETLVPLESLSTFLLQITGNHEITKTLLEKIRQGMTEQAETKHLAEYEFKDKQNRDILIKVATTSTSQGTISGSIITLIDLSRIREEERQREQTMHFLSHDMRAPQSAIQALIKMQQRPETALSTEDFLQEINQLSRSTLNLVDNFLYLARAKNTSYQLIPINLNDLLQNVIDHFWGMCKAHQMSISLTTEFPLCYVLADGALLSRAFNNLVDNAIKYGKKGMSINIAIHQDQDQWVVSIRDQGLGIAKEDFSRIFKVFSRAPSMQAKRISGLGLGLAFVHTAIVGHQGNITLESEEGVGTTFYIRLPIFHDEESV